MELGIHPPLPLGVTEALMDSTLSSRWCKKQPHFQLGHNEVRFTGFQLNMPLVCSLRVSVSPPLSTLLFFLFVHFFLFCFWGSFFSNQSRCFSSRSSVDSRAKVNIPLSPHSIASTPLSIFQKAYLHFHLLNVAAAMFDNDTPFFPLPVGFVLLLSALRMSTVFPQWLIRWPDHCQPVFITGRDIWNVLSFSRSPWKRRACRPLHKWCSVSVTLWADQTHSSLFSYDLIDWCLCKTCMILSNLSFGTSKSSTLPWPSLSAKGDNEAPVLSI